MSELEIVSKCHPLLIKKYEELRKILSPEWRPYNGLRTFEEQAKLYAVGRTVGTIGEVVTRAVPGMSYHNYGLALDWAYFKHGYKLKQPWELAPWPEFDKAIESVGGLTWGGHFINVDKPHMQLNVGVSIDRLLAAYNIGGLAEAWKLVTIKKGE